MFSLFFGFYTVNSFAQQPQGENQGKKQPSIEERLKMISLKVCEPLDINEIQTKAVISAFRDFYVEVDKIMRPGQKPEGELKGPPPHENHGALGDQKVFDKPKIEALEKIRNEKVKKIIPDEKYSKYLELELASRPKLPNGEKHTKEGPKR